MKLLNLFQKHHCFTLLLFLLFAGLAVNGQLQADFIPDKTAGCSPLNISFTNKTTGASGNAVYIWDFGNGNTSVLKNPAAIFYAEKTYTVTLTVKDGSATSVKTKTIIAYKKPVPDFTFSDSKGCVPFAVTFNSVSSPGDGSITAYYWDYGDGATQQTGNVQATHTYNFPQTASVTLTATNSFGCTNTIIKKDILNVLPSVQAAFSAEKNIYCQVTDEVRFTNNSAGPGTLSYEWDFGDGTTSTQQTPSHFYSNKGTYSIKLTAKSPEGCSNVMFKNAYIHISDFKTDFNVPDLICTDQSPAFTNTSSPVPLQSTWLLDGNNSYVTSDAQELNLGYSSLSAGTHTLALTNDFDQCQQTITKQFEVKDIPHINGFIADVKGLCGSPVQVNFKDTTTGAVKWLWNFGYYTSTSDVKEPSYVYTRDDLYYATLTVTNSAGCTSSTNQQIYIGKPLVGIYITNYPANYTSACDSLQANFTTRSTEEIINYSWDFGDGTPLSTEKEPVHVYKKTGFFTPRLTYTTINNCSGTADYPGVRVYQQPVADFTVEPSVCGNSYVFFNQAATGDFTFLYWDFGDNTGIQFNNAHRYQQEGTYDVTLIAGNGYCFDTIQKKSIIKISPPFPKIGEVLNTCEGTRGLITIADATSKASKWTWNFDDGTTTSYTTYQPAITHTYSNSGVYKVVLTTEGDCILKDSVIVNVLIKKKPLLTVDNPEGCLNTPLTFHIRGLDYNYYWFDYYDNRYTFTKWEYTDGSLLNGYFKNLADSNGYTNYWGVDYDGGLVLNELKDDKIRAIIQSAHFGCYDTTDYVAIKIKGVNAGFEIVTNNVCFKSPVLFKDTSRSVAAALIKSWEWDFGDGTTQTSTNNADVIHLYTNPGSYTVTLKVTDATGCSASITNPQNVNVTGPKAAFNISTGNTIQLNTNVTFYNNTNNYNSNNTRYMWNFGDGFSSTAYSPDHTYTIPGNYTVTLIAVNPVTLCSDTASQNITVRNFNSAFSISGQFIGNNGRCAPALARFTNKSSNYVRVTWDFGDGLTLENQNNPSHIYKEPGIYIITLYVYGYNGLTGTYKDTLRISSPVATISSSIIEGCKGLAVKLNAPIHTNTSSYAWDFGDGNVINTVDSFAGNNYLSPGMYSPSLIATDANGCSYSVALPDKIIIRPDPVINITPATAIVCKGNAVQLNASGGVTYTWSPSDGLDNAFSASPLVSPVITTMYSVQGKDDKGCTGNATVTVAVAPSFMIQTTADASICAGERIQLNTTGADTYEWINNTTGLSNIHISNPFVSPAATTSYTVVGYDKYQCFTDTASVKIIVNPSPTVNAGPDIEIVIGSDIQLNTLFSNDVINWSWSPAEYLNCIDCSSPVSKPRAPVDYTITVKNQFNCKASDTVKINVACAGGQVYIPSAFSPNGDGKNDRFIILGNGIRIVKSLRIYNRWGGIIFERKNFYPDDANAAWDGKNKGVDTPAGAYVFIAEMECNANEIFTRKGTVTLIR